MVEKRISGNLRWSLCWSVPTSTGHQLPSSRKKEFKDDKRRIWIQSWELYFSKKSKRIKGGNDHHHENAEHQILATRIYLIYMSVKYDFHRKNTVTLDHILAPNLNVQSCRQHQERKNLQSPPLEYADLPCPGCCTDSPSCPSPSPHPESYISNIPIFIK